MSRRQLIPALLAIATLTACEPHGLPGAPYKYDAGVPELMGTARSSLSRASPSAPQVDQDDVVAGNNDFAFALHQALRGSSGNLMTSPYSISLALGMAWAGARGRTESQLARALHFSLPQTQVHPAFNAIDQRLQATVACPSGDTTCTPFTFAAANSIWAQRDYPFQSTYLDTLAVHYGAGLNLTDYLQAPEAARLAINDWVAQATKNKILDLLGPGTITNQTRLVLTNAVYFKGQWQTAFEPQQTAPGAFALLDGSSATVPLMHGAVETRGVSASDADAVELRYHSSSFSMLLIAPQAGTFSVYEAAFDTAKFNAVEASLTSAEVKLSLPTFAFESKVALAHALAALGMVDAFGGDAADFSGIATGSARLSISDVVHQANIAVDEKGTEAAAATAVVIGVTSVPATNLTIDFNRPFLFVIREVATGQVVFLGRVVDPR